MALTAAKVDRVLGDLNRGMTHERASKLLGVNRSRVTQLVSSGDLPRELTVEAINRYKASRDKRKAERDDYLQKQRERREQERAELLARLDALEAKLDAKLNLLLGATVASAALR